VLPRNVSSIINEAENWVFSLPIRRRFLFEWKRRNEVMKIGDEGRREMPDKVDITKAFAAESWRPRREENETKPSNFSWRLTQWPSLYTTFELFQSLRLSKPGEPTILISRLSLFGFFLNQYFNARVRQREKQRSHQWERRNKKDRGITTVRKIGAFEEAVEKHLYVFPTCNTIDAKSIARSANNERE